MVIISAEEVLRLETGRVPQMWIMKITPDEPRKTKENLEFLFGHENSPNFVGFDCDPNGKYGQKQLKLWRKIDENLDPPPIIVIMEGRDTVHAAVVVTGPAYERETGDEDGPCAWMRYRRPARLLGRFDPPCNTKLGTNPTTIIDANKTSNNATQIAQRVWKQVQTEYWKVVELLNREKAMKELEKQISPVVEACEQFGAVILQGPPGTSKTWTALRATWHLIGGEEDPESFSDFLEGLYQKKGERWDIVQFHPSYQYEDFVRGIQARTGGNGHLTYETVDRVFARMAKAAANDTNNKYVLILDEINRANVAAVLGELIFAIEYRGRSVTTPYAVDGQDSLVVPENLIIIGTMNTADRSIGRIDYAVRRRFVFIQCKPEKDIIEQFYKRGNGPYKDLGVMAASLFEQVNKLFTNEKIASDFHPDDVQIGHTYFMAKSRDELVKKFCYQVYPLLREYFKDGIFRRSNNQSIELRRGDHEPIIIIIDPPMDPSVLFQKVNGFLEPEEKAESPASSEGAAQP